MVVYPQDLIVPRLSRYLVKPIARNAFDLIKQNKAQRAVVKSNFVYLVKDFRDQMLTFAQRMMQQSRCVHLDQAGGQKSTPKSDGGFVRNHSTTRISVGADQSIEM